MRRGSGGSFHLSFRSGSRGGGASGAAAFDYVTRKRQVRRPGSRSGDLHRVRSHAVVGARTIPREYWDAADLYERANGRLYVSADFALPRDLGVEDQIASGA